MECCEFYTVKKSCFPLIIEFCQFVFSIGHAIDELIVGFVNFVDHAIHELIVSFVFIFIENDIDELILHFH